MFSCEYCRIFKITCFEKHLQMVASFRCYFEKINLKQSGFCATYSFKIFISERKYKNNLKNREPQKIYIIQFSYTCLCNFYYEILWFYQYFKSEHLCFLNLYSVHTARMLDLSLEVIVKPAQLRNEAPLQL